MPYVKFLGGHSRDGSQLVMIEDRSAPCFAGLAILLGEARCHAEALSNITDDRARIQKEYLALRRYDGLAHMSGVGFVDDDASVGPHEELITRDEYDQLSRAILAQNADYRAREGSALSAANDSQRRALLQHEALGWRTRSWITSHTVLDHHVPYVISDTCVAYMRVVEHHQTGQTWQLIDIYHSCGGDVSQALLEGIDWANTLVDYLALLGYGAAGVASIVGTTVPTYNVGQDFPLALFEAEIVNRPVRIAPSEFPRASKEEVVQRALRHVRDGLSAVLSVGAVPAFWNTLEALATEYAQKNGLERTLECKKCHHKRPGGVDLRSGFIKMYQRIGLSGDLFDAHRGDRGKVQHGEKLRTTEYVSDTFKSACELQPVAVAAVSERIGVVPAASVFMTVSWPVTILSCSVNEFGAVDVNEIQMNVTVAEGLLPQQLAGVKGRETRAGVVQYPVIDDLTLPCPA